MPNSTVPSRTPASSRDVRSEWRLFTILWAGGLLLTLAHRLSADEGQVLTGAWNLFNDQRIYQDFFEFIGPASFVWVEVFFELFGPSYWSALAASQLLLALSLWAYLSSAMSLIDRRGLIVASATAWLLVATMQPFVNHNSYSSFLGTVYVACMLRALRQRSGVASLSSGALASAIFFFLQPKGAALLGAGLVAIVGESRWSRHRPSRQMTADAVGATHAGERGAGSLVALYVSGAGAVALCGAAAWGVNPAHAVVSVARGVLAMNHLELSYIGLLQYGALALLVVLASFRAGLFDLPGRFLFLTQVALWCSTAHLPDPYHLLINSFPLLLMTGRLVDRSFKRTQARSRQRVIGISFALFVLAWSWAAIRVNIHDTRTTRVEIAQLQELVGDEGFFAFTFLPSFYLELQVENPYYNSVLYVGGHPPDHFDRNVALLARERPRFVLLSYPTVAKYGHHLDNPVDRFIRQHYRFKTEFGALAVWELS